MSTYATLTDKQLADAIVGKTAAAETERAAASLQGIPARLAAAKRIDKEVAALKAEQVRRAVAQSGS